MRGLHPLVRVPLPPRGGGASFVTAVGMWVLYEVVTGVVPVVADRIEGIPREEREEREERAARPPRPMIGLLIGALLLGGWYLSATGRQWGLALIAAGLVIAVAWQVRRQRTADQAPDDEAPDDQVPSDEAPDDQEPSALPSGSDDHHAPGTPRPLTTDGDVATPAPRGPAGCRPPG